MESIDKDIGRATQKLLYDMSVGGVYRGVRDIVRTMDLARKDETLLYNLTQNVYMVLADEPSQWKAVESRIRTVARIAWKRSPWAFLERNDTLLAEPANFEFLDTLLWYLQHPKEWEKLVGRHKERNASHKNLHL